MGRFWVFVVATLMLAFGADAAWAQGEKRVALVIGNAAYRDGPLKNPVNDARAMAARLRELGFEVVARENLTKGAMEAAIGDFGEKLSQGAVGMLFYAGHGIQVGGRNYIIPVDARLAAEQRVKLEAVDVETVLDQMAAASTRVSLAVLDACRNNPFERRWRGGAGGLAQMNAPAGTMIAYATAPGSVAADGDGIHGVYTAALLDALTRPGLKAEEVFKAVRAEVARKTKNQQTPWESSSLIGDFVFNVVGKVAPTANGVAAPADREALFWQSAQASNRAEEYEEYLKQFPAGMFAGLARSRIAALKAQPRVAAAPTKPDVAVDPIDKEYVVIQPAQLREAPDPKSRRLVTLKEGDTLLVLGKVRGQPWLQVERRGEVPAYVSVGLVEEVAAHRKRRDTEAQQAMVAPSPTPAPPLLPGGMPAPGRTFRDCAECPEMVVIPAGKFTMGSPPGEAGRDDDEGPQFSVAVRSFAAGKYEVTLAEWDACVSAGGCTHRPEDGGWGRGDRPAINVSWDDVKQYLAWLSRRTGRQYRLLSEAEWEYAARAGTSTPFHTGATITPDQANFNGNYTYGSGGKGAYREKTVGVGSFAPNQFGLHEMHGNVWEWVEDCYNASYAGAPTNGAAWRSGDCGRRVLRGGSWCYDPGLLRSANRDSLPTTVRYDVLGFRVATTN